MKFSTDSTYITILYCKQKVWVEETCPRVELGWNPIFCLQTEFSSTGSHSYARAASLWLRKVPPLSR